MFVRIRISQGNEPVVGCNEIEAGYKKSHLATRARTGSGPRAGA